MSANYFFIVLHSFSAALVFVFLLRRLSKRYGVLISGGIPLVGGIAVGLALFFIAYIMIPGSLSEEVRGIIAASFIMLIFGIIDDFKEFSILAKFLVQIIATSILILFGVKTQIMHIGILANILVTFIWVLGISNAFNHLDVVDGVAGTSAITVSLAFFAISLLNHDFQNAILTMVLCGAILGFLVYNLPPAKVYLGNSGSHFLGFIFAAIAMSISYAPAERKAALLSPLFILGLPIFDTMFLTFMRIKQRKSIFKKSDDHLALKFIKLGYSKNKTLVFMLTITLLSCLAGIIASQVSNIFGLVLFIVMVSAGLTLTYRMSRNSPTHRCLEKGYLF